MLFPFFFLFKVVVVVIVGEESGEGSLFDLY